VNIAGEPDPDDEGTEHLRPPLPEERVAGTEDAEAQAGTLMEDSEERLADRDAAPGSRVEHRSSEEATPPA
jgi:hypothetical protein